MTATEATTEKQLDLLEEDDDFEEFPEETWDDQEAAVPQELFERGWDDEDIDTHFLEQLQAELAATTS